MAEIHHRYLEEFGLVLSNAKTLDLRSNVYCVQDAAIAMIDGNRYSFIWEKD
jgi:hypothetical protein